MNTLVAYRDGVDRLSGIPKTFDPAWNRELSRRRREQTLKTFLKEEQVRQVEAGLGEGFQQMFKAMFFPRGTLSKEWHAMVEDHAHALVSCFEQPHEGGQPVAPDALSFEGKIRCILFGSEKRWGVPMGKLGIFGLWEFCVSDYFL